MLLKNKLECFFWLIFKAVVSEWAPTDTITTLFSFVMYEWAQQAKVFFLGKPFQPRASLLGPFLSYKGNEVCEYSPLPCLQTLFNF